MLKKMVVILAVLMMASTVFGWSASKWGGKAYNPDDPNTFMVNPGGQSWAPAWDGSRTVDWETDGNTQYRKGESWNWPASYDFIIITDVKVQMDVGFFIKLNDCSTNKIIKLKQRSIRQYGGQVSCSATTNVATEWKADFIRNADGNKLGGGAEASVDPATFPAAPGGKTINIRLKLWDVNLQDMPAGVNCLDIGIVRVSVRPTVRPNSFMSGCGGSYPQYAPKPYDDSIPYNW